MSTKADSKSDILEGRIAFQGEAGANSHIAAQQCFPDHEVLPCVSFEDVFAAMAEGRAIHALIPIENSVVGRVADIHRLLPQVGGYIVGEHFMRINHCLLAIPDADLNRLTHVHSHEMALSQCRETILALNLEPVIAADTAGAARQIATLRDPTQATIASELAAEIYKLQIVRTNIEDNAHNTTRFVIMAPSPDDAEPEEPHVVTSFIFRVRNVPSALYKALGGFATNGVNMTRLESYQPDGTMVATQFYADIEGHPDDPAVRRALDELTFFCSDLNILGVYKAAAERFTR